MVREVLASFLLRRPGRVHRAQMLPEHQCGFERRFGSALAELPCPVLPLRGLGRCPVALDVGPDIAGIHTFSLAEAFLREGAGPRSILGS